MERQGNILIVDDKPDNLRLLSSILTDVGYKVRKVLDGNRALDAAHLEPPDLILLDIMMPQMDGYEVCDRLKAGETTRDIPIIFLSALNSVEDKIKAFSAGGVDYITKPFRKDEVIARVNTHLQMQNLTQDLKRKNARLTEEIEQRKAVEAALTQTLQDLKTAQEQIIAGEKLVALGALTAGIAHELRNPLNFVNNYAEGSIELAQELSEEIGKQLQHLDAIAIETIQELVKDLSDNAVAIYKHGQRAEQIIGNMMQHARTESGPFQSVDLHALIDEAKELVYHNKRAQNPDFNVTFQIDYAPDLEPIKLLPNELSRAFINLIENAYYAVQKKQTLSNTSFVPTITLRTRRTEDGVEIKVRDNGTGISPIDQTKIFEPFFTTKPAGEGTGLGLSITHEIVVRQHGGSLRVETEENHYTEFTVVLPVAILNNSPK